MKSMTGFGQGKETSANSDIEVNLRAVNGRFLEPRFHLPREFVGLEGELRKILQKSFSRGTLDIFISRKIKIDRVQNKVHVQKSMVREYHQALKIIAKEMKIPFQAHVELVAKLPEVLKVETADGQVTSSEKKSLLKAMEKACQNCLKEQTREGLSLQLEFQKLLKDFIQNLYWILPRLYQD